MFDNGRGMTVKGTSRGGGEGEEWEGVGSFPCRHSPGHDLLFTRDARNSLCLLGAGRKTAGKRLGLATCLYSWPTSTFLPAFFYFGQQTPPSPRRFVNTCLFADLFDLRVDDDTTQKLNEK